MDKASEVLVIIVSSVLTIFLLIGIVLMVRVYQVVNSLKEITRKAEKLADSAEAIGTYFQRAATPLAISKFISNVAESVFHHNKKNKNGAKSE